MHRNYDGQTEPPSAFLMLEDAACIEHPDTFRTMAYDIRYTDKRVLQHLDLLSVASGPEGDDPHGRDAAVSQLQEILTEALVGHVDVDEVTEGDEVVESLQILIYRSAKQRKCDHVFLDRSPVADDVLLSRRGVVGEENAATESA